MSPPFNLVAEELGYKNFMDLNASGIVYPHQQLVSGRDFTRDKRDTLLRFLKGFNESLGLWMRPESKESVLRLVAQFLRIDPVKNRKELEDSGFLATVYP